jgi:hypothetical protein
LHRARDDGDASTRQQHADYRRLQAGPRANVQFIVAVDDGLDIRKLRRWSGPRAADREQGGKDDGEGEQRRPASTRHAGERGAGYGGADVDKRAKAS